MERLAPDTDRSNITSARSARESAESAMRSLPSRPVLWPGSKEVVLLRRDAARSTVVVDAANRRRYPRFNCDVRLVNKRAASTAHRRFGKWRYYADLPAGWDILEHEKGSVGTERPRGKNGTIGRGKVAPSSACKTGKIFVGLLTGACASRRKCKYWQAHVRAP